MKTFIHRYNNETFIHRYNNEMFIHRYNNEMFIHRYNNEIVPKSIQQIEYALELPSQYLLKYLSHHIRHFGKKFLRT